MKVQPLEIPDVKLLTPRRFDDPRGFFSETYNADRYAAAGIDCVFVQDNHSRSARRGTLRGLHYQNPPHAQAKLVRVVRGAVFDVAVDIRRGSPTYGRHVGAVLSAENWSQMFVPTGFAHGYCTLESDTEIIYKVDALYAPAHEHGLFWADPDLAIDWPVAPAEVVLSDKDRALPRFADLDSAFAMTGNLIGASSDG